MSVASGLLILTGLEIMAFGLFMLKKLMIFMAIFLMEKLIGVVLLHP